jgi:hypothetical protein
VISGSAISWCCDSGRAKSIKALDALMIFSEAANAKQRFVKSLTTASAVSDARMLDLASISLRVVNRATDQTLCAAQYVCKRCTSAPHGVPFIASRVDWLSSVTTRNRYHFRGSEELARHL